MDVKTAQGKKAAGIAKACLSTQGIESKGARALDLIARLHGQENGARVQGDMRIHIDLALRAVSPKETPFSLGELGRLGEGGQHGRCGRSRQGSVRVDVRPAPDIGWDPLGTLSMPLRDAAKAIDEHDAHHVNVPTPTRLPIKKQTPAEAGVNTMTVRLKWRSETGREPGGIVVERTSEYCLRYRQFSAINRDVG